MVLSHMPPFATNRGSLTGFCGEAHGSFFGALLVHGKSIYSYLLPVTPLLLCTLLPSFVPCLCQMRPLVSARTPPRCLTIAVSCAAWLLLLPIEK